MMNELYFEKVPHLGNLYLDYVFHEFEGEPILFMCTDNEENLFLCTCFEIRYEQKWLVAECNVETLGELIRKSIDIKTALCKNEMLTTITMNTEGKETHSYKKISEINELDFPKEETYLMLHGMQEQVYLQQKIQKKNDNEVQSVKIYIGKIKTNRIKYNGVWSLKETVEKIEAVFESDIIDKDVREIACGYDTKNVNYNEERKQVADINSMLAEVA